MKKKGFTLIELLAVIVILAIIALIVTPVVSNIILSARKAANARSVEGHIKNIEYAIVQKAFEEGTGDLSSYDPITDEPTLRATLTLPESDKIICDELTISNGTVVNAKGCKIGDWDEPFNYTEGSGASTGESSGSSNGGNPTNNYVDAILNGADPVLGNGLIPVTIDNDGTVKKANTENEWYNYGNKVWANAVILKDNTVAYENGDTIPENNIDAYFVWIPKFKYKLFDEGNYTTVLGSAPATSSAQTIDIVFDLVNTTDSDTSCSTPLTSGDIGNCAVDKYMTHPSFITMNVNGYWVGKFEPSGTTSDLDVKPNAPTLRTPTLGEFFTSMYNYNRSLESHMMKNTEWGAVTYLSLSNYGINGEVRINNNSQYVTGCAATVAATTYSNRKQSDHSEGYISECENEYNTSIGYLASTTGNISGIYDMSGGAWEYVAGYKDGSTGSSGLTPSDYDSKYFDVYNSSSSTYSYNYRILGDATGEMGPLYNLNWVYKSNWFGDSASFLSFDPWFVRGGTYYDGVLAGQTYFNAGSGGNGNSYSARLVLAP